MLAADLGQVEEGLAYGALTLVLRAILLDEDLGAANMSSGGKLSVNRLETVVQPSVGTVSFVVWPLMARLARYYEPTCFD
jgi:hypothetical protein